MSAGTDNESEILLGNKQLLAVFAVVVVLLAIAFTGGYMVGRNSGEKKTPATQSAESSGAASGDTGGPSTHVVPPAGTTSDTTEPKTLAHDDPSSAAVPPPLPDADAAKSEPPLGSRKTAAPKPSAAPEPLPEPEAVHQSGPYIPQPGQTFLQVAAVGKDEAEAVADVLQKKGYHAHSVPKPGNTKIYRVVIGPIKDAGDLASMRDSLRKTGFREVITQRY